LESITFIGIYCHFITSTLNNFNNKNYPLTEETLNALVTHQSEFRIGTLGPDIFPDPVVGQITAHPGLPDGWKTDDWIQHVLKSAVNPDEIAFAYGYACHAAMDIFAHTYVNAYSGDIFLLTDSEMVVELRHFALEKYIGLHTPSIVNFDGTIVTDNTSLLKSPTRFLTNAFILNDNVTSQYAKSGSFHLVAMNSVYNVVKEVDGLSQDIIGKLTEFHLDRLKEQYLLAIELDKKIGLTNQLELDFKQKKL
jgi:hypothetical protein